MLQFNMNIPAVQFDVNYPESKKLVVTWPDSTEEVFAWFARCVLLSILIITSMLFIVFHFIVHITEHKSPRQEPLAIRACYTINTSYFLRSSFLPLSLLKNGKVKLLCKPQESFLEV